jgi:hypothetical protein
MMTEAAGRPRAASRRVLRHDGQVTDGDLLSEAAAELYSADPDEFTERRGVLAGRARAGGEALVAKQIAALRTGWSIS